MHAPWLSHCKSSWSCVNWKLSSKHLGVTHGVIPHAAKISALTRWSRGPFLRDARYVNKLFNFISLTECGFYGHLEEDGLFYLNMDVYCRSRRYSPLSFSKLSRLKIETDKKQERSLFCYMLCSKTMSVELHGRSHPAPRIYEGDLLSGLWTLWVSGVEGVQGYLRVSWLQRFHVSKILTISRVSGFQRSKG